MITYIATNTLNGKFYIGSTTDLEKRKGQHLKRTKNLPFQNALRLNPEAFRWEFFEDEHTERIWEQALLDLYYGSKFCYNLNPNVHLPPENKGVNNPNYGKRKPEETKRKISEAKQGIPFTEEHKRKLKEAKLGTKRSKESREKQGKTQTGAKNANSKKTLVIYPDGTSVLFPYAKAAAEELGCHINRLRRWARSGHTPAKGLFSGYSFRYV